MPWKLCAGHGAADVGPPRPRSCGHVATKTLNQCVFERHAAVRHERAVPAYGSFHFRDDLKASPTGTSPCSHGAETYLDDAMSMEATLMPPRANSRGRAVALLAMLGFRCNSQETTHAANTGHPTSTWITVVILELIHASSPDFWKGCTVHSVFFFQNFV